MRIRISNEITIEKPTPDIKEYCKANLVVINPEYEKKQRMGFWVGDTPRELWLYRTDGDKLICPVGAFSHIKKLIDKDTTIETDLAKNEPVQYGADVGLYEYQEAAVKAMCLKGYGILRSPAGSGKTQMGVGIVNTLGVKTLWLTHTHDLLNQSYDRFAQYVPREMLGKIAAGKVEIGSGVTFATVQTLCKQDLGAYKYTWDCVIVDECHRCAGTPAAATQFSKVLNGLAARYKFGLSATVHRADGLIKTTYALVGDIAYDVPESAVRDKVMTVKVTKVDTGLAKIPCDALDTDGTIIYTKLISEIATNERRNNVIHRKLQEEKDHFNLILSDRLDQLRGLYEKLPIELKEKAAVIDGKMTSKKARAERAQAIEDMREGKKHFLFATYKLAKEGLDIPRLDRLHLATPQKDYAVIVQSVGRIGRTFPGKEQPVCLDYVDDIGLMQSMYNKRRAGYRKIHCQMEETR